MFNINGLYIFLCNDDFPMSMDGKMHTAHSIKMMHSLLVVMNLVTSCTKIAVSFEVLSCLNLLFVIAGKCSVQGKDTI